VDGEFPPRTGSFHPGTVNYFDLGDGEAISGRPTHAEGR